MQILEQKLGEIDDDDVPVDLGEIENVVDEVKRSLPEAWMVRANSICRAMRLPFTVLAADPTGSAGC